MKTLIECFEAHLATEEKRPQTIVQYGSLLRRFERFLIVNYQLSLAQDCIRDITGLHLSAFMQTLQSRDCEISTRNNYTVILKCFFEFLQKAGMIENNPSKILHCVRKKKTPHTHEQEAAKCYTKEEISTFMRDLFGDKPRRTDLRDAAILALILGSGLRAFEVCSLNVSQMDQIRSGTLYCLRKGGNWSEVSVADYVPQYIERYLITRGKLQPEDPLFVSQKGYRLERRTLWSAFAAKQSLLDLKTGVHIFRHTLLTAVDHNGGSALARDIGGHSSVRITNRYMHPSLEERREAVSSTAYANELSTLPL